MSRSLDISQSDTRFLLNLLHTHKKRGDDRAINESRPLSISYGNSPGHVNLSLGLTRLVVRVSAEIVRPNDDRPHEGTLIISTDTSAMAHPRYDAPSTSSIDAATLADDSLLLTQAIETAVRRAAALDVESLVVKAGRAVWAVRADIHYLADDGGLIDASSAAVLAALLHFRLPATDIKGEDEWIIYPEDVRPPVPLAILHIPISVTFSIFRRGSVDLSETNASTNNQTGNNNANNDDSSDEDMDEDSGDERSGSSTDKDITVVDATAREEILRDGSITITVNSNRELCHVLMPGGVRVAGYTVISLANSAYDIAKERTELIKKSLDEDEAVRRAQRMDSAIVGGEEAVAEHNRI